MYATKARVHRSVFIFPGCNELLKIGRLFRCSARSVLARVPRFIRIVNEIIYPARTKVLMRNVLRTKRDCVRVYLHTV